MAAAVSAADREGRRPLWVACQRGHGEVVDLLLQAGADVGEANAVSGVCIPPGTTVRRAAIGCDDVMGGINMVLESVKGVADGLKTPECFYHHVKKQLL